MFRLIAIVVWLLVGASAVSGRTIVRPLDLLPGHGARDTAVVRFYSGGHLDPQARGLAVVDQQGQPVRYRLLGHDPAGQTVLAVDVKNVSLPIFLHSSSDPIHFVKRDDQLPVSLMLRTYALKGKAFADAESLMRTIDKATPLGVALVDKISFAHNPFSDNVYFITDVQGLLNIPKAGEFRIFSAQDDAAFVMIDGRLVIAGTSPYTVRNSETLAAQALSVQLSKGMHRIRYVHIQKEGGSLALLGYIRGRRALPMPRRMFVHHPEAVLGKAIFEAQDVLYAVPVGFDAQQIDEAVQDRFVLTRIRYTPIAAAPTDAQYNWTFGDGTTARTTGRQSITHIHVHPLDQTIAHQRWRVTLELKSSTGSHRIIPTRAVSTVGTVRFGHVYPLNDPSQLKAYARAIGSADYQRADAKLMGVLYQVAKQMQLPTYVVPLAEPYVRRFGNRNSRIVDEMRYMLATYYASGGHDLAQKAADLFGLVAQSHNTGWLAACAMAQRLDLMIVRLQQADKVPGLITAHLRGRPARQVALLKCRLGDVYRYRGDMLRAREAYQDAQRIADRKLDPPRAVVLQNAYRETILDMLKKKRYPAMRDQLLQWEADFPQAKLGGDLPLLTGRYFQAIGNHSRAAIEYETLLKLNPIHPSTPQVTFRLAQSKVQLGKMPEATMLFTRIMEKYPNSPFADQARRQMQ